MASLRREGCAFLSSGSGWLGAGAYPPYLLGLNMCVEDGIFFPVKPLSYWCPEACGCRSGDAHCPDACPARNATTPLCPEHQRSAVGDPYSVGICPMGQEGA